MDTSYVRGVMRTVMGGLGTVVGIGENGAICYLFYYLVSCVTLPDIFILFLVIDMGLRVMDCDRCDVCSSLYKDILSRGYI